MTVRTLLFLLFTISGFAGLIYESIWSHYLKLVLGHAAYAQTLVLSLFMGGMALGAWLCGRLSERIQRPLFWYAMVELALGTFALAFDPLFRWVSAAFLDHLAPALGVPALVDAAKWSLAGLLILPPCILLGATFPLISSAVFRLDPARAGRTLGWLYFTNSIGAVLGVLTSGLLLIRVVGLPGTLLTAALLNFSLAACVWIITKRRAELPPIPAAARSGASASMPALLLAVTFASSAASFCYEIGWIRMLSLVLGSATHSFELMLAAFILGLALGSLFIRNRIDGLRRPLLALSVVQVAMGVFALSTLAFYEQSFGWMAGVMDALSPTDAGYTWYLLSSAGISMLIMLPATICAGMTLPLITASLLHAGHGESSIGRVYAANTLGAIVGVLLAVHVLMPWLGARQVVAIGGVVDVAIGLWLWRRAGSRAPLARTALGAALACGAVFLLWKPFDQALLSSGVFRHGEIETDHEVRYHRDGKTATVHVYGKPGGPTAIATNGKVDAALSDVSPTADDYTMVLTAALPLSMRPESEHVAVIGFGSGRSTHTFLQSPTVRSVETIEIEAAMVEGARLFGPLVEAAYLDPRSTIHIDDAKTYFARGSDRYDIIASEPSNPWVSGVASLFTREFYRQVKRHLKPGGLFVQWLQTYESDLSLLSSVFGAMGTEFADYAIYASNEFDLIVVASADGPVPLPADRIFTTPALSGLLGFINVTTVDDLSLRYVGDARTVGRWLAAQGVPANSDYFPFVDQHAAQARFARRNILDLQAVQPFAARLAGVSLTGSPTSAASGVRSLVRAEAGQRSARALAWLAGARGPDSAGPSRAALETTVKLLSIRQHCRGPDVEQVWLPAFQHFLQDHAVHLDADATQDLIAPLRENACQGPLRDYVMRWLDFADAISRRDHGAVRALGGDLIAEEIADRHALTGALVYEVLLADLIQAGPPAVAERMRTLGGREPPGPVLDFLIALARAG